jgi:hypothetical protein
VIVRTVHTKLREGNQLATISASFVDPVDSLLNRKLDVEPPRLSIDGSSLVLLDSGDHFDVVYDESGMDGLDESKRRRWSMRMPSIGCSNRLYIFGLPSSSMYRPVPNTVYLGAIQTRCSSEAFRPALLLHHSQIQMTTMSYDSKRDMRTRSRDEQYLLANTVPKFGAHTIDSGFGRGKAAPRDLLYVPGCSSSLPRYTRHTRLKQLQWYDREIPDTETG